MPTRGTALSGSAVRNGLKPAHDGLGPERVVEIQRVRMLSAMMEVCREGGTENVTVARLVERAGVSRRTFYELFSDREDCFLAAFDEGIARASQYVLDSYDPGTSWVERIRTLLIGWLSFLDTERGTGEFLVVGSLGAGTVVLERRRQVLARIIAVVDEGRRETKTGKELSPFTAEGIVGGVLSVLQARLLKHTPRQLLRLTGPLMSMIVLPYLGPAAARRESRKPVPKPRASTGSVEGDPLRDLGMRLTYRTMCVLMSIAADPGSSNRGIGVASGVPDQGQISKLLGRLQRLGLVENRGLEPGRGAPNSWILTTKGARVEQAMSIDARAGKRAVSLRIYQEI